MTVGHLLALQEQGRPFDAMIERVFPSLRIAAEVLAQSADPLDMLRETGGLFRSGLPNPNTLRVLGISGTNASTWVKWRPSGQSSECGNRYLER